MVLHGLCQQVLLLWTCTFEVKLHQFEVMKYITVLITSDKLTSTLPRQWEYFMLESLEIFFCDYLQRSLQKLCPSSVQSFLLLWLLNLLWLNLIFAKLETLSIYRLWPPAVVAHIRGFHAFGKFHDQGDAKWIIIKGQ
jgi:hypothetical protein